MVNAIRKKFGKKPFFRRRNGGNGNSNGNNGIGGIKCRYCQKMGHMQKVCKSRIRDRAPMVDASGKPFQKRVNAVDGQDDVVAIDSVFSKATSLKNWE